DLQHGIVAADTAPRPSPEGQMSEGRVTLLIHFGEPFVIEILRVLPVLRRMVRAVDEHNDRRSPGYIEIACAVIRESHSIDHPKWRIKAQRLQYHLSCELELGNVGETQRLVAQYRVELLSYSLDTIRTRTQQIEKPR